MSPWMVADDAARKLAALAGQVDDAASKALLVILSDLAVVVRDTAERVGLRAEGVPHPLEAGKTYTLKLEVQATVKEVSDGHGLAYELELERRDFYDGRTVSVDADEVVGASDAR